MSVMDGKIAEAVLQRIRTRGQAASGVAAAVEKEQAKEAGKIVSVSEAQFSDFESVCALNLRLGQGPDSVENWRRLWVENPALQDGKGNSPIGWMLKASNEVVGFLGSIPLQYEFEGRALRVAATCRLAVDPAYRASTHLLVVSFFRQKNVDVFLNSSATVEAGRMMVASKASPLPQSDYGTVFFWVVDPRPFTKEVFKKLGVNSTFAGPAAAIASLAIKGDAAVRGRVPRAKRSKYFLTEIGLDELDPLLKQFWSRDSSELARLSAKRTPEIMRWHFDPPHNRRKISIFACSAENKLAGYVIVRHEQEVTSGIRRSLVADMMIQDDDPVVLEHLLAAAFQASKKSGCHVLEVMGFPQNIRQKLLKLKPYTRKYPACPFYYKARERSLHEKLANESVWYASPFDGDATLWP
jgi:hypothetical protein